MMTKTPAPAHGQPILSARTLLAAALAAACAGSAFSPKAQAAPPAKAGQWAAGRILVQAKAGYSGADLEAALNARGARGKGRIAGLGVQVVEVPAGAEDAMVRRLSRHPGVKFAEKDMRVPPQFSPDDSYFGSEWHLGKIQSPAAWDSFSGAGVVVAVLDSGVDAAHPDLSSNMVAGWNVVSGSADTADIHGHGTAVAGTVAAATNNAAGVASVAWGARLMPVRITNDPAGYAYWSDVANGLAWAADHGAKVANVSYAVTGSATVEGAAQYMQGKGGVVVVSAGNDGADPGHANSPYLITVSATDSADAKAGWSSYGSFLDVAAPGVGILTTTRGGGYGSWSGTSFSSPVAAGVAALIMDANPALSPGQVDQVLKNSADKPGGADFDINYGYGRVNAASAVRLALDTQALDAQAPNRGHRLAGRRRDGPGRGAGLGRRVGQCRRGPGRPLRGIPAGGGGQRGALRVQLGLHPGRRRRRRPQGRGLRRRQQPGRLRHGHGHGGQRPRRGGHRPAGRRLRHALGRSQGQRHGRRQGDGHRQRGGRGHQPLRGRRAEGDNRERGPELQLEHQEAQDRPAHPEGRGQGRGGQFGQRLDPGRQVAGRGLRPAPERARAPCLPHGALASCGLSRPMRLRPAHPAG